MQPWVYCSACERLVPGKPPCSREVDTGCEKAMWSPVLASFLAVVAGHLMVIFELSSGAAISTHPQLRRGCHSL